MSRTQIIAIIACVALLAGIFLFGKTKKPNDADATTASQGHAAPGQEVFNIEDYLTEINAAVADKTTKDSIDIFTKAAQYKDLIREYQKIDKPLAVAYYSVKFASVKNNITALYVSAGDYNSMLMQSAPDEKSKKFLSGNAIECYKSAVALDSTKTDNRIRLAGAYMEDGSQPMQGVLILLDVVRKDSNNIDAQLMLGRFGLISGQIDKAIARFEKILYLQPQNPEALFLLAQAYNSEGNKEKALELLEKCKKTVDDQQAKKEIEDFIENIKKAKS